ncbi:MAG: hypothetical protein Tsb0014_05550 [Pleurocapsa sp.]
MKPVIFSLVPISFFILSETSIAQVTPDNTVNTQVEEKGKVAEITGGETRDGNLFHSFQEFSLPRGNEAFFNNADTIQNIFSRVTGGKISNIYGLIRANGSANLFLINPSGIILGENARLDIGGSFYGSSASSILFPNNIEFSADNPTQPVLTVNAPIGLNFRDNPGAIVNNSVANNGRGLTVSPGNNITLLGGDVNLDGGKIYAPGGIVNLGGLTTTGTIEFNDNGSLTFPDDVTKADVKLSNKAAVDVRADGGGFINVDVNNLTLSGQSELLAGIAENMGDVDAQAGDIKINATNLVKVIGDNAVQPINDQIKADGLAEVNAIRRAAGQEEVSADADFATVNEARVEAGLTEIREIEAIDTSIRNYVGLPFNRRNNPDEDSSAVGNSGKISITTNSLEITNRASINSRIYGMGNGSDINITAKDISADNGSIVNQVRTGGIGNSGNINFNVDSLSVANFGFVITNNFGQGNAGDININATDSVFLGGKLFNGFISEIGEGVTGDAGDINITAKSLTIDNSEFGAQLLAVNKGIGDAGNVNITATDNVTILNNQAGIITEISPGSKGKAGDINITTNSLKLEGIVSSDFSGNAIIQASSKGTGNAGNITINARENIILNRGSILSQLLEEGLGVAGDIKLNSPIILLDNFSLIANGTTAEGTGGAITITADNFTVKNFSILSSNSRANAMGDAGDVVINVSETTSIVDGGIVGSFTVNDSNGGTITIDSNSLEILRGGKIVTQTDGGGNAGNTNLNIANNITIDGSNPTPRPPEINNFDDAILNILETNTGLFASTTNQSTGDGGNVRLVTQKNLNILNDAQISVDSLGTGNGGTLDIKANSLNLDRGTISASTQSSLGGIVNLQLTEDLNLNNNSQISARAFNDANGGNIDIDTKFLVTFPNRNNDIIANAAGEGNGGNININAEALFNILERPLNDQTNDINASSRFGLDGRVSINTIDINSLETDLDLPNKLVEDQQTNIQACRNDNINPNLNNLIIKGKDNLRAEPTAPLNSDLISVNGTTTTPTTQGQDSKLEPIATSNGDIMPARGVIVTKDKKVILTAYPTDNINSSNPRTSQNSVNCQ